MSHLRQSLLQGLSGLILAVQLPHPVRVAIDGIDAAGKTTLADELAGQIRQSGRTVLRASVDGFHRPRADRYRRGEESLEGYYLDSFDYDAVRRHLLMPLGPTGNRRYRLATFDYRTDSPIAAPQGEAPKDAVLLFDGVFLLRPELNAYWEFRIFVEVDFDEALRRAVERDRTIAVTDEALRDRYLKRYLPGQRMYLESVKPIELADAVVENSNLSSPRLLTRTEIP